MINPNQNEIDIINQYLSKDKDKNERQWRKLKKYVEMVLEENERHNLIGANTISQIWTRHIIDSIQLMKFINIEKDSEECNILDLGSGAGFPVIVLGIVSDLKIIMVEKSPVKADFLTKVCKELGLNFQIVNQNINKQNIKNYIKQNTILTSRAFKSINEILTLVDNNQNVKEIVLLKGAKYKQEIEVVDKKYSNLLKNCKVEKSILDEGVVIVFENS